MKYFISLSILLLTLNAFSYQTKEELNGLTPDQIFQMKMAVIDFLKTTEKDFDSGTIPQETTGLWRSIIEEAHASTMKEGETCFFGGWPSKVKGSRCPMPTSTNFTNQSKAVCRKANQIPCQPILFGATCVEASTSFRNLTSLCERASGEKIQVLKLAYEQKNLTGVDVGFHVLLLDVKEFCDGNKSYDACQTLSQRIKAISGKDIGNYQEVKKPRPRQQLPSSPETTKPTPAAPVVAAMVADVVKKTATCDLEVQSKKTKDGLIEITLKNKDSDRARNVTTFIDDDGVPTLMATYFGVIQRSVESEGKYILSNSQLDGLNTGLDIFIKTNTSVASALTQNNDEARKQKDLLEAQTSTANELLAFVKDIKTKSSKVSGEEFKSKFGGFLKRVVSDENSSPRFYHEPGFPEKRFELCENTTKDCGQNQECRSNSQGLRAEYFCSVDFETGRPREDLKIRESNPCGSYRFPEGAKEDGSKEKAIQPGAKVQ